MAELLCDFEAVKTAGKNLIDASGDYDSAISTYDSGIDNDLAGWVSSAKNAFQEQKTAQVAASKVVALQTKAVGEYVKACAEAIEELEQELASKSI